MQNGSPPTHRETAADIKSAAIQQCQQLRSVSAPTLLRTVREQVARAGTLENEGDLKGALKALTIAAHLTARVMVAPEVRQEKQQHGMKGPLNKELSSFTLVSITSKCVMDEVLNNV